jgi:predicted XRE-type DNA-binding protein
MHRRAFHHFRLWQRPHGGIHTKLISWTSGNGNDKVALSLRPPVQFYEQKNHRGSDFRDFLNEQGVLGEVEARALKQALSLQLDHLLKEKELAKTQMATRMKTSRAAVDWLLDASNSSVTLNAG